MAVVDGHLTICVEFLVGRIPVALQDLQLMLFRLKTTSATLETSLVLSSTAETSFST